MRIDTLSITNFRGYKNTINICFSELTAFVGKNDIGKSSILEALDIFFSDGKTPTKIEKADVNILSAAQGDTDIVISVVFSDLPDRIIVDATFETTLSDEYLLNCENKLEIVKRYPNGGSPKVFIKALHPTAPNCADLLLKKNSELKKIIHDERIECESLTVNSTMRQSIWRHYNNNLGLTEVEIDAAKEDAKKIWDKLSSYLPMYSLFQSDRKSSDGDSEIQDPLKEAVKQILADREIQDKLDQIAEQVKGKLTEVSSRTLEKLREMDPSVANSLSPEIPATSSLKWNDVFKNVSITGDNIPINKRGSGVKRMILLNFFRAESERKAEEGSNTGIIYAIEEPETSQHEANQLILIEALKVLSTAQNVQVILTTHSQTIVKNLEYSNLRLLFEDEAGKHVTNVQPGQLCYPSLNEVNYIAFEEPTIEYYNELYGFMEYKGWMDEYKGTQPTRLYKKIGRGGTVEQHICTAEYIRHQIHHPENRLNALYTRDELTSSIISLREFITSKQPETEE